MLLGDIFELPTRVYLARTKKKMYLALKHGRMSYIMFILNVRHVINTTCTEGPPDFRGHFMLTGGVGSFIVF